jgi:redox-regulated HSP33 family molecular chaperone
VADRLARTLSADGTVRGLAAVTTDLVEEARVRHSTLPTATAALGRTLTAALLLGGLLKTEERVSLQFSGDGPLGGILADATPEGTVRGFVSRPQTHLPPRRGKLDVGGAVGRGLLCVMRVPRGEGPPYRSVVPLVSGEIGQDVASYLVNSEQTPSVVAIGVFVHADGRVGAAGGYLLQAMPGAEPATLDRLEENVGAAAERARAWRGRRVRDPRSPPRGLRHASPRGARRPLRLPLQPCTRRVSDPGDGAGGDAGRHRTRTSGRGGLRVLRGALRRGRGGASGAPCIARTCSSPSSYCCCPWRGRLPSRRPSRTSSGSRHAIFRGCPYRLRTTRADAAAPSRRRTRNAALTT